MEVRLVISEEYEKYFEYIPTDVLPDVINSLLGEVMKEKFTHRKSEQSVDNDMLMALIKSIQSPMSNIIQNTVVASNAVVEKTAPAPPPEVIKVEMSSTDYDDFMDMLR